MSRTYTTASLLSAALLFAAMTPRAQAQNFDTSGTSSLSGAYLFRYVNFFNDELGNLTESCTLSGTITFDGSGHYTLSQTQLADSAGTDGSGFCASLGGGTYAVQSNGMAQLDNPLYPATLLGTFSHPVVIASSTEDDYFDLFIAVQAPAASSANGVLSGNFTVGTLDFPNSSASLARQGFFSLNADGQGNIAAFTVNGSLENVKSGESVSQPVAASTYSLSGASGGRVTFPGSSTSTTNIIAGEKLLYVSSDGNWLIGGSASGSDMLFGFKSPSGTTSNSLVNGTYFIAGMEDGQPGLGNLLDAFYGSINTNGAGELITHQRFDYVVPLSTYDNTFNTSITLGSGGSYYDGSTYTYLAGATGGFMQIGSNQQFSLIVGMHAPSYQSSSKVWIDPIGITNAANYTPITNSYAPGELVNLFGTFGVSTQTAKSLPISTTLGGVQVMVNGQAAPVYLVSQNQISALIPYEVAGESFATFQVLVNGTQSNAVTVYLDNSAPGVYTQSQNGIGDGAILHSNGTVVKPSSPAKPGEAVAVFLNGLGPVTPQVGDGVAAPTSPLSVSVEAPDIAVFLFDGQDFPEANVSYAGLAPYAAGLYQINFTLPDSGLANGESTIFLGTNEAFNGMATIDLSGFSSISGFSVSSPRVPRFRPDVLSSRAHSAHARLSRRALPGR